MQLTKSQVDRLGDRLRENSTAEEDLHLLEAYRQSFVAVNDQTAAIIKTNLGLSPTVRQIKTTASIIAKLQRGDTKLSRMQDIAGCRLIVSELSAQDEVVRRIRGQFETSKIIDRRLKPSHGYRAVHVIVQLDFKPVEIQVRTKYQDIWAEISEKLADKIDRNIKYGGGPESIRSLLLKASEGIAKAENNREGLNMFGEPLDSQQSIMKQMMGMILDAELGANDAFLDRL